MRSTILFAFIALIALAMTNPAFARKRFNADQAFYYELSFNGGGGAGSSGNGSVQYGTGLAQFEFGFNLFTIWNKNLQHRVGVTLGAEGSHYKAKYSLNSSYYDYLQYSFLVSSLSTGRIQDYFIYEYFWKERFDEYRERETIAVGPMVGFNYHFYTGDTFDPYAGIYFVNQGGAYRRGIRAGLQIALSESVFLLTQIQGEQIIYTVNAGGAGGLIGLGFRL